MQKLLSTGSLPFWNEIHLPHFKYASISPQKSHLILNYTLQYRDLQTTVTSSTVVSLIISAGSHLAFSLLTSSMLLAWPQLAYNFRVWELAWHFAFAHSNVWARRWARWYLPVRS